jgi:hypothetical protein
MKRVPVTIRAEDFNVNHVGGLIEDPDRDGYYVITGYAWHRAGRDKPVPVELRVYGAPTASGYYYYELMERITVWVAE